METKPIKLTWVIDDDPLQVLVLNRLLTTHKAVQASKFFSGAKSAMDALSNNRSNMKDLPDLVFLDLIMVHGDGWDFLDYYKKVKNKLSRKARIVVISSPNDENTKRVRQYLDVFGFLSKPINVNDFEAMMASVIEKEVIQ